MITKESPKRKRGRQAKYVFKDLKPGDCLKIHSGSIASYRSILTALCQYKRMHAPDWETTSRYDAGIVSVYRLK